jgi:hypothetical protein
LGWSPTLTSLLVAVGSAITLLEGELVRVRGFGELEAVVIDRVWSRDPDTVTVREIFDELSAERRIAYTTVMSTMDNCTAKVGSNANATAGHTAIGPP